MEDKGTDASNQHDEEVTNPDEQDFSDDEQVDTSNHRASNFLRQDTYLEKSASLSTLASVDWMISWDKGAPLMTELKKRNKDVLVFVEERGTAPKNKTAR